MEGISVLQYNETGIYVINGIKLYDLGKALKNAGYKNHLKDFVKDYKLDVCWISDDAEISASSTNRVYKVKVPTGKRVLTIFVSVRKNARLEISLESIRYTS